jgi:predicted ABC-type ATPase
VVETLTLAGASHLTTKDKFAIDKDGRAWLPERRKIHNEIINNILDSAAHVPCEYKAVIAGGLGGAGKTTVLDQQAGIDRSAYLTINPDSFKEILAARNMVPRLPGLSPMESSSLAHEESSHIARILAARAMAEGKNIIWDVTLSSVKSANLRVDELKSAGYGRIDGIFVDIPIETSVERAEARHRRGHDRYLANDGLGGRCVTADIIRSQADPNYGSANRGAFESIKDRLTYWAIYDNSVNGRPAVLVDQGGQGEQLDDQVRPEGH